jgi:hypothetical protein
MVDSQRNLKFVSSAVVFIILVPIVILSGPIKVDSATVWSDNFNDEIFDGWTVTKGIFATGNLVGHGSASLLGNHPSYSVIHHDSDIAVGTWSFDLYYIAGRTTEIYFMTNEEPMNNTADGYKLVVWDTTEGNPIIKIRKCVNGWDETLDQLITSSNTDAWIRIIITRNADGEICLYTGDSATFRFRVQDSTFSSSQYFGFCAGFTVSIDDVVVSDSVDYDPPPTSSTTTTTLEPTLPPLTPYHEWLDGWTHRKKHTIESVQGIESGYQIRINVFRGLGTDIGSNMFCNSICQPDFDDIRITKSDGISFLAYWRQDFVVGENATLWVRMSEDLSVDRTIYVYYGNSDAQSLSDGNSTFIFFDDFEGESGELPDSSKWELYSGEDGVKLDGNGALVFEDESTSSNRAHLIGQAAFGPHHVAIQSEVRWTSETPRFMCPGGLSNTPAIGLSEPRPKFTGYDYIHFYQDPSTYDDDYWRIVVADAGMWSISEMLRPWNLTLWGVFELKWFSEFLEIHHNNRMLCNTSDLSIDANPNQASHVEMFEGESGQGQAHVDWVFVRMCVNNEPVHGSWYEETIEPESPSIDTFVIVGFVGGIGIVAIVVILNRKRH